MDKGKLITFEGIDTSGKSTQVKLLADTLKKEGYKVKSFHFPMYNRPIGAFIESILKGEVNTDIDMEAMQMLYIADQLSFQKELKRHIKNGYIVIMDRYDLSTIAYYASMTGKPLVEALAVIYDKYQHGLMKPDLTCILGLRAEEVAKRKTDLDIFEQNTEALNMASNQYYGLYLTLEDRDTMFIDASEDMESIAKTVYEHAKATNII